MVSAPHPLLLLYRFRVVEFLMDLQLFYYQIPGGDVLWGHEVTPFG